MTLSAVHRPLNPPFRRAPGASVRPRLLAFFVGGSVFAPLFADQKAAKNTSRRLRSVLFAEKRYKEVLRAKTAVVLVPLQAIIRRFKTRFRRRCRDSARTREHANMGEHPLFACSRVRAFATRASRSRQPQPKSRVSSGSARCCGTPRDRPRSEARYTRCGPIRCTRSAKRR